MEKIKSKIFIILFLGLISIMLGGCGMFKNSKTDDLSTKEKVQKALLVKLKDKYGKTFKIQGKEKYKTQGSIIYYSCEIKDDNANNFEAYINSVGKFSDNYFAVPYRSEASHYISSTLSNDSHVNNVIVELDTPTSSKKILKGLPLSEFISQTNSVYNLVVDIDKQDTDKSYATIILNILSLLYEKQIAGFTIRVTSGDVILFEDTYTKTYDNKRTDYESILDYIETQKITNNLIQSK